MEMAIGGEAAAAAGKSGGATASGEYWSEALKSFLDHIPVSSLSGAVQSSSSPALELNLDGCVPDAIGSMYRSNVGGAVIVDEVHSSLGKFVDRDIGFVDFPSLVLWALEELDKVCTEREDKSSDFLSSLKCHSQIAETKIAWLAKLFLWEPFFPVRSHDTLFHAMLLFSKHQRLNVIPVVESVNIKGQGHNCPPLVEGMLSIMRACKEAGTVKRVVFTSSAGSVNIEEQQRPAYDQDNWSDIDFCRRVKMTRWMYFVSKSLAEKAAMEYARENGVDFISIIPTLVVGPFLSVGMPPSLVTALALITGNEAHYSILKQVQLVHLDDLCDSMTYLFEHPDANGRYICSSHDTTIHGLARMLQERFPEYEIPQKFAGIDEDLQPIHFSSKKLLDHGFRFRYTAEDMFDAAVRTCREKGLIPLRADVPASAARKPGAVLVSEGQAIGAET